jgi:hypothetical protein
VILADHVRQLAERARAAGADAAVPVFNAAGDDRTGARFWLDSLLNEAVVHGFDAAAAAGHDHDLDTDVAAALITNHLAMLTSPTWTARRPDSVAALRGTGQPLLWRAAGEEAGHVTIDGDAELARHWVEHTAHVAG